GISSFASEFLAFPDKSISADANGHIIVADVSNSVASTVRLTTNTDDITNLDDGVLFVLGGDDDDTISIDLNGSNVVVTHGSATRSFPASDVHVLDVSGGAGNDGITNNTALKSTLRGGGGNDT